MFGFLVATVAISLSGVMAPGPITAATLAAGTRSRHAGALIALGHLVVELPLILLLVAGIGKFLQSSGTRVGIGLTGGAFLLLMGVQLLLSLRATGSAPESSTQRHPFWSGIVLTGANPYFLLWWATVGRKKIAFLFAVLLATACSLPGAEPADRVAKVAKTKGLIAFWDFSLTQDGRWTSYHDENVVRRGFPVSLRRIGDPKSYTPGDWPYTDEKSKLMFDSSGPFGHAVRFNQGYVFAEVARSEFDKSPLDIHGRQPFTLIAWAKFVGQRHLVAGIWDEGGWDKYGGRRQIALFGGLFGSKGIIGHVSSTGASSYPQSTAAGSQYARCRAIDGRNFENGQWVAMAMSFDPGKDEVVVYCDGVATPTRITDPVAQDVFQYKKPVASNPFHYPWPIFSPRSFILKFNGYKAETSSVYEHWLHVDTEKGTVVYGRSSLEDADVKADYWVTIDVGRAGSSILTAPVTFQATKTNNVELPVNAKMQPGDEIVTSLDFREGDGWRRVGKEIRYRLREGAPFTFGRALGLGSEPVEHGTQLYLDGVAVFNRVLGDDELRGLSFADR